MSDLRQAVSGYLAMRRALGFSLVREGQWLMDFADYDRTGRLGLHRHRGLPSPGPPAPGGPGA